MTNSEIKKALQLNNTEFTVKGLNSYNKDENGKYLPQVFHTNVSKGSAAFYAKDIWLVSGMNVSRFGAKKVSLFTYTAFGKKASQTVAYSQITITKLGEKI